ncbi:MAG: response regulator transcription factor [Polyangiaceae bacterium]|nr:response regulator transcription factor [Polyangiaceae bacterium]
MRILVVEDETRLGDLIARSLRREGYDAELVGDGAEGFERARTGAFDLVVLDVMLPRMSGLEISMRLRRLGLPTRLLMLTARDAVDDRVAGLDAGADDYVVKPFALSELHARVRALLRREGEAPGGAVLRVDDLVLDRGRREARRGERRVELTSREFALLEHLMRNAGRILTRDQILVAAWPRDFEGGSNVVDTYVHYLREKIDRPPAKPLIRTIRGVGYALGS